METNIVNIKMLKSFLVLFSIFSHSPTDSFALRGLSQRRAFYKDVLFSVKRKPDRFTEWEVRKKGDSNQSRDPAGGGISSSGSKAASYRNAIADSSRIADTTSLINRRTKPSQAATSTVNVTKHEDSQVGLVIERLGGSLLVEVGGEDGASPFTVVCYQRSSLTDSVIVVGDKVDLLIVRPTATNTTTDNINSINLQNGESQADVSGTELPEKIVSDPESDITESKISEGSANERQNPTADIIASGTAQQSQPQQPALPLQGVVLGHHQRLNLLQRPSPFNSGTNAKNKAIAANINQIILVVSALPVVPLSSIDRILVAAHEYGMDAIVLLNKMDLEGSQELFETLGRYSAIGYPVLKVSVKTMEGLSELRSVLRDKCSVFVGQSGIGKSSLVNTLLPDADYKAKTGALVRSANLGAHTTSSARLFHLPEGGTIIDSPGIRELGLWHLSETSIKEGFREIDKLTGKCKFRNCKHTEDTLGCAVQQGVRDGTVHPDRLESYFTFLQ